MERDRGSRPGRGIAVVLAIVIGGFLLGAGAQRSLALFTSSVTVGGAFTTATSFGDTVAPAVSATVISKAGAYFGGFVKQGGSYFVYANATDGGVTPTGIASITADVGAVTTGQTAVPLVAGTFTVEGASYGFRSAALTADAVLAEGPGAYSLTSTDNAANSNLQTGFGVTIDNTAPTASDVQTANGGANTGRIQSGDTIVYTFSEIIDPESILAGWTGTSTNVVVRFTNIGINDTFAVWDAANATQLALGSVNTHGNYVTAATTAGASGTPSTMVLDTAGATITITLGTVSGSLNTDPANNDLTWSPSAAAFDRAGVTMSATTVNESGGNDREF